MKNELWSGIALLGNVAVMIWFFKLYPTIFAEPYWIASDYIVLAISVWAVINFCVLWWLIGYTKKLEVEIKNQEFWDDD
jgi:hypothetical protein